MNPLVFAILMASAPPAAAPDPGCTIEASPLTRLFDGVRSQTVTVACPSSSGTTQTRVHVVRVHVTAPGIAFANNINVAPPDIEGDEFFGPNARTVVGLSLGKAVLWVAAVTRETSRGLTLRQAAQMLQELGAANAINLDGGGSTSLAVDSGNGRAKLLNVPSAPNTPCTFPAGTGCERYVGASFAIHARPLAQAPHPVRP